MTITSANWVRHPGFFLKEEMEARGWLQRDLAFILGCPEQALNMILSGKRGISPEMAGALGDAFDVPAEFFANLQQSYDLSRASKPDPGVAVRARMQGQYPIREMIKRGWIEQSDPAMLESQLARFFQVKTADEIPYMPHAAKKSKYEELEIPPAQLAWLFRVRQIAGAIPTTHYSELGLRRALNDLQGLLVEPEQVRHVPKIMAECGVKFILVERLPQANIDGVCFWLDRRPVIGMSLRRDKIDNFWFVLRHEIEHVLRGHGKETAKIDAELEGEATSTGDTLPEDERVANAAAADFCAPVERLESFMQRKHPFYYEKDVVAFAHILNRHPGLVVGQMQRRLNDYAYLTKHLSKVRHLVLPAAIADGWGQVMPVAL